MLVEVLLALMLTSVILASVIPYCKYQATQIKQYQDQKTANILYSEAICKLFEQFAKNTIPWKTIVQQESTPISESNAGWQVSYTFVLLDSEKQKDYLDELIKVSVKVGLYKDGKRREDERMVCFCLQKDSVMSHDSK